MNKIFIIIATLFVTFQLDAQQDSIKQGIPELPGDEVEVIKDFEARLAETQMLRIIPQSPIVKTMPLSYKYNVELRKLELDYLPPVIRPVALPSLDKMQVRNTLLQLGYGYPRLSEGLAVTNYQLNEKLNVGLRYKHLASSHNERLPSGFYRNDGNLNAAYMLGGGVKARAEVDMAFNKNEVLTQSKDFRNDRYDNAYGVTLGVGKSMASKGNLYYDARFSAGQFRVNDLVLSSFRENNIDLSVEAGYVKDLWRAGVKTTYWNSSANVDSLSSLNAVLLNPYGIYAVSGFKVNAGFTAVFSEETKIYPQVELSYSAMGDLLVAKAFAQTRFNRNNHQNTYVYNPFISQLSTYGVERQMQFGVGVSGRSEKWSYDADVFYSIHEDIQEFSLDSLSEDYIYSAELVDARAFNVRVSGDYQVAKNVGLNTSILYRNLIDAEGSDILGYYDVEWEIGSDLRFLNNKFSVSPKASFLLFNPLYSDESNANFIDLQLDLNYDINKKVGVYVKGFNLLNSRNARWEGYDALGVSVLGGVRVIF